MMGLGCKKVAWLLALAAIQASGFGKAAGAQEEPAGGIEFVSSGLPGLDTVYLRSTGTDDPEGLLRIEVWANEVSDLYAVSFTLKFPQKHFKFPKGRSSVVAEGPFLGAEGSEQTVLAVRQSGSEIVVGHTRVGDAQGVVGSGRLMTLEFRGLGIAGTKKFRFRRTAAFDSSGAAIEGYRWLAGKAIVTVPEPAT